VFVFLYEMKAKAGLESKFEDAWAEATEAIFRVRGSLGSRLHKTDRPGYYIAYAQWPSASVFDMDGEFNYDPAEKAAFEHMRSSAESIQLLQRLDVCKDLLR
jgi:heme-degrading monooxygenase HmoA